MHQRHDLTDLKPYFGYMRCTELYLNILYHYQYSLSTVNTVCAQVTDTSHTAGLTMHATILAYMFSLVEQEKITAPLGPGESNLVFIQVNCVTMVVKNPDLFVQIRCLGIIRISRALRISLYPGKCKHSFL